MVINSLEQCLYIVFISGFNCFPLLLYFAFSHIYRVTEVITARTGY